MSKHPRRPGDWAEQLAHFAREQQRRKEMDNPGNSLMFDGRHEIDEPIDDSISTTICPHCQPTTAGQHQIEITSEPPMDWKLKAGVAEERLEEAEQQVARLKKLMNKWQLRAETAEARAVKENDELAEVEDGWRGARDHWKARHDGMSSLVLYWKRQCKEADRTCEYHMSRTKHWICRFNDAMQEANGFQNQRNTACRHAVRLDERRKAAKRMNAAEMARIKELIVLRDELATRLEEQGGQILALELELCEKVESIKGLAWAREKLAARVGELEQDVIIWKMEVQQQLWPENQL